MRSQLKKWKAGHPDAKAHPSEFDPIRRALRNVPLGKISAACDVSSSAASTWRSGNHVPALRHWSALAALVGLDIVEGWTLWS